MGCDGGTIPRRNELVRLKKKPEQKDKNAERSFKWRNCALSQQPLQAPVVACALGRLYTKSAVLEALRDTKTKPDSISHIKSEEDIKDLTLVKNPAYVATEHTYGAIGEGSAPYICPITGIEMTGKFRFVFLWSCGCVLAERALKEVKVVLCHMCQQPFTNNDVTVLNGTEDDIELLKVKMATRLANTKTEKPKAETTIKTETVTSATSTITSAKKTAINKEPSTSTKGQSVIKQKPEAGTSRPVKKEIETIPLSLPKYNPNKVFRGHFGSNKRAFESNDVMQDPSYKKTKKDYSIAEDPERTEVYKSLFTSHSSEKKQQRAHWVTYNPFYN